MERVESKVFKVKNSKNGISNLQEFEKVVDRRKVYDLGLLDEVFGPKRVFRCAVCKELTVESGEINAQMDLFCEDTLDGIEIEKYPFMHFGCLALGFMGLGSKLDGSFVAQVIDTRLKEGSNILCAFRFNCNDRVSAFIDFPDFCVSTHDIVDGFTISIRLRSEGLEFIDGAHPLALNVVAVCRFMDDRLESKMLIKKHGKRIYQAIGETEILNPKLGALQINPCESADPMEKTMSDVAEVIRRIKERVAESELIVGNGGRTSKNEGRSLGSSECQTPRNKD